MKTQPIGSLIGAPAGSENTSFNNGLICCDGVDREVPIKQYPKLYAVIGDTYGKAAKPGYFRIPYIDPARYAGPMYIVAEGEYPEFDMSRPDYVTCPLPKEP